MTFIRDGEAIEVVGVAARLSGVMADTLGAARGKAAKVFKRELVHSRTITCTLTSEMAYDREVDHCAVNG